MIISASRRTDIPAFHSDWFMERIKAGYVYVRNPMNPHQISHISLSPEMVDGIVFWTKDPTPMIPRLDALKDYMYYFQFTITSYGTDVERNIPIKDKVIIPAFQRLSDLIGPERVIWRYDPIFLNETYTLDYHFHHFEKLAERLSPYTRKCTISFLDFYRDTAKKMAALSPRILSAEQQERSAKILAEIAHSYGLRIDTCAEGIELQRYGIEHARCIDDRLFERLLQCSLDVKKDRSQRPKCGCIESVDIGAYDTCYNGCLYCYADHGKKTLRADNVKNDPDAPLLTGEIGPEDKITRRKMLSCRVTQLRLEL